MGEFLKRFFEWSQIKTALHQWPKVVRCKEREIWWVHLGVNVGDEEDGKNDSFERPAIIVKKFYGGKILWMIPLTTAKREGDYYFGTRYLHSSGNEIHQFAMIPHLRAISQKRLVRKLRVLPKAEYSVLAERIKQFLDM